MLLMQSRSSLGQGVLLAPPKWTRHPLKIEEATGNFVIPGTRSLIEMFINDLNNLPYAKFISYFPLVCLLVIPLMVIVSPVLTVYVFNNTWILSIGFPAVLLLSLVMYCVCYNRYKKKFTKVIHYHRIRLAAYYSFSFPCPNQRRLPGKQDPLYPSRAQRPYQLEDWETVLEKHAGVWRTLLCQATEDESPLRNQRVE
jgi:glucan phosphoethanolaminetransferase (alkaline phosphatase superfamily)